MIVSGQVKVIQNLAENPKGMRRIKILNPKLVIRQGYKSHTTSKLQLGLKSENQWLGEDCLILKPGQPMRYSAQAVSNVIVY